MPAAPPPADQAFFDQLAGTPPRASALSPSARRSSARRLPPVCAAACCRLRLALAPSSAVRRAARLVSFSLGHGGFSASWLLPHHQPFGARTQPHKHTRLCSHPLPLVLLPTAAPTSPQPPAEPAVIDGPPGDREGEVQRLLFVGNYQGAVDACLEVR